ncbi:MAG: hypothetical protein MJB12_02010 [Firmicutes bacterium]|nr:hypothetical protein [Bacillota bacterium]
MGEDIGYGDPMLYGGMYNPMHGGMYDYGLMPGMGEMYGTMPGETYCPGMGGCYPNPCAPYMEYPEMKKPNQN